MSTCYWGVSNNTMKTQTLQRMQEIAKEIDVEIEEIKGRFRVSISKSNDILNEAYVILKIYNSLFDEPFLPHPNEDSEETVWYYWIDGPNEEQLMGLTRYGRNCNWCAEPVLRHLFECEEIVHEYDSLERLVEVGVLDPSCLCDDEEYESA